MMDSIYQWLGITSAPRLDARKAAVLAFVDAYLQLDYNLHFQRRAMYLSGVSSPPGLRLIRPVRPC